MVKNRNQYKQRKNHLSVSSAQRNLRSGVNGKHFGKKNQLFIYIEPYNLFSTIPHAYIIGKGLSTCISLIEPKYIEYGKFKDRLNEKQVEELMAFLTSESNGFGTYHKFFLMTTWCSYIGAGRCGYVDSYCGIPDYFQLNRNESIKPKSIMDDVSLKIYKKIKYNRLLRN